MKRGKSATGTKRKRSPSYPAINLKTAMGRAFDLYEIASEQPAPESKIIQSWGFEKGSGQGRLIFGALKKYGLLIEQPAQEERMAQLSELALAIIHRRFDVYEDWVDTIRKAALTPRIHRELWNQFEPEFPPDEEIRQVLLDEKGFTERAANKVIRVFKKTLEFAEIGCTITPTGWEIRDLMGQKWEKITRSDSLPSPRSRKTPAADEERQVHTLEFSLPGGSRAKLQISIPFSPKAVQELYWIFKAMEPGLERIAQGFEEERSDETQEMDDDDS